MPATTTRPRVAPRDPIARAIHAVLDRDRERRWTTPPGHEPQGRRYDGYAYAATEAYFHLAGGRAAGLVPMRRADGDSSHWWLAAADGRVIDLSLGPRDKRGDYPYEEGRPCAMRREAAGGSRRAREIIDALSRR